MQNLTVDLILERLNPHFHDDFLNKTSKLIHPDEKYWAVGNWSHINRKEFLGPPELAIFGYYLVTSYRTLQVVFEEENTIFSEKRERIMISGQRAAFSEISYPLTEKEIRSRELFERPLKKQINIRLWEETGKVNGSSYPMTLIGTDDPYAMYFVDNNAGHEIYLLLVNIVHEIPMQVVQVPNLAEQLEKLTDLHRYQVITDEEFEAAKKRLGL